MKVAIDVNRYVDFQRGVDIAVGQFQGARQIFIPFVVLAELRAGFRMGLRRNENEMLLTGFLNSERVSTLFADEGTTHVYAELFEDLRHRGKPIPTNDLWIAALVIQHDLVLLTRDRHFESLPRVPRM